MTRIRVTANSKEKLASDPTSRRDRVLDEAARQLNAHGISTASLAEVAGKLGVSRAALYNYIEDREDLVFQCYRRSCEVQARRLDEAIREGGDAFAVIEAYFSKLLGGSGPEIAALSEIDYLRPAQQATILGLQEGVAARLADVLEASARRGEVRPCDYDIAAHTVISFVYWLQLARRWAPNGDITIERLLAATGNLLADGVATHRAKVGAFTELDLSPLESRGAAFDRQALGEARREAILAAASRLFNLRGVDATPVEDIAAQLGTTKRTLYNHFGDKKGLVAACVMRAYRMFVFIVDGVTLYQGPRAEALCAGLYASVIANLREDLSPFRQVGGIDDFSNYDLLQTESLVGRLREGYARIFEEGGADGSLRPVDIAATLSALPGGSSWVAKVGFSADEGRRAHIAREIALLLTIGLKPL